MSGYTNKDRCEILAEYLIENNCTVRATASHFSISKSTVHKDVSERLSLVNPILHSQVKAVLDKNKSERHIRGGVATKKKYQQISANKKGRTIERAGSKV